MLSIIMPVLNEEELLPRAYDEVTAVMRTVPYDYEVLLIDNCSTDRTPEIAEELCRRDSRWRYIRFSRDFLAEISQAAGLRYARGDAAIFVASDLQDPPEMIPEFLKKWEEGYDVVLGIQKKRPGDPAWRNLAVEVAYFIINKLSDVKLPKHAGDFRLLSRPVIDAINGMGERTRYLRGMSYSVGFKRATVHYSRRPRQAGDSKAPFWHLINFTITAIIRFSIKPLHLFTLLGVVVLGLSTVLSAFLVANYFLGLPTVPGVTSTHLMLMTILGFNSLGFGVLGEYVGRIYTESKSRPLWIIDRTLNIEVAPNRRIENRSWSSRPASDGVVGGGTDARAA